MNIPKMTVAWFQKDITKDIATNPLISYSSYAHQMKIKLLKYFPQYTKEILESKGAYPEGLFSNLYEQNKLISIMVLMEWRLHHEKAKLVMKCINRLRQERRNKLNKKFKQQLFLWKMKK